MKRFVIILVCLVVVLSCKGVCASEETIKDAFPDENFRGLVMQILGTDDENDLLSVWEDALSEISVLNGHDRQISSIEGINYLTGLEILDISQNEISEMKLVSLKKLDVLIGDDNPVRKIDLSGNSSLKYIYLQDCRLSEASFPVGIEKLYLKNNALESIDLKKYKSLSELNLSGNLLSEIDLSDNSALKYLWLTDNRLEKVLLPHRDFKTISLGEQHFSVGFKKDGEYSLGLDIVACSVTHSGGVFNFCIEDLPGYVECVVNINGYPMSIVFDAVDLRGDINGDYSVNHQDLSYVLDKYLTSESSADVDGSGKVDSKDLSIILYAYSKSVNTVIK